MNHHQIAQETGKLLVLILIVTLIISLYHNLYVAITGEPSTFLFIGDSFADTIKLALSYPFANDFIYKYFDDFPNFVKRYALYNDYSGIHGIDNDKLLTHFHITPLSTLYYFCFVKIASILGVINAYLFTFTLILFSFTYLIFRIAHFKSAYIIILLIMIICFSYPLIFSFQRGNITALIVGLLLSLTITASVKGNLFYTSILIFGIIVNIRPNAVIFLPLIFFFENRNLVARILVCFLALLATALFGALFLFLANFVYPDYSIHVFLKGYEKYQNFYVFSAENPSFAVSLLSLAKWVAVVGRLSFNISLFINAIYVFTIFIMFFLCLLRLLKKIQQIEFLSGVAAIYVLYTPVFADYHLIVFFGIIVAGIFVLSENTNDTFGKRCIMVALYFGILMLLPFNLLKVDGVFIANHIKTLFAIVYIFWLFCTVVPGDSVRRLVLSFGGLTFLSRSNDRET